MKHTAVLCLAVVAVAGCGPDPREAFVGDWNSSSSFTMTVQGVSTTSQDTGTLNVTEGDDADELRIGQGTCPVTAEVTSDTSFTIQKVTCPPMSSGSCQQMTLTINHGTGTRTGSNLNVTLSGTFAGVCGGQSGTGTFTMTWAASKMN
ncbi:MAG: hypothetical protein L0Y64_04795 [Myxococcaceae bacterium]|nr:hypothetical protein [Myxococcaceae bacterium]